MSFPCWISPMRRVSFLGAAVFLAASLASAQSADNQPNNSNNFSPSTESSSQQMIASLDADGSASSAALPSAPEPAASAAGQETTTYSGWKGHDLMQRLAFEASGGFNAPVSDSVTYGGQFTLGAGVHFDKRLSMLAEYQFLDAKLPGSLIAEAGATGGHAHIWSFTLDPVVSLFPKSKNDIYVTGGGGFYRKVTSFTDPELTEYCYYFCSVGTTNAVVGHFSSNQGGWNIGGGYEHRLGGMYGDSKMTLFAEARYVDVLTPAVIGATPNGLGATTVAADTKMIPVNLGVRF
jgi:opacity protein-like surface antigen